MLSSVFESSEWLSMLSKEVHVPLGGKEVGGGSFSTTGQVQMNVDGFFLPVLVLTFQICFLDWRFLSLVWFEFGSANFWAS
jgi:hypothetical protein